MRQLPLGVGLGLEPHAREVTIYNLLMQADAELVDAVVRELDRPHALAVRLGHAVDPSLQEVAALDREQRAGKASAPRRAEIPRRPDERERALLELHEVRVDLTDAVGHFADLFDPDALDAVTLLDGATGRRGLYLLPVGFATHHVHAWKSLLEQAGFTLMVLLGAGGETTTSLIGNSMRILAERPALQAELRRAPERVPAFIEEVLRFESPFRWHPKSAPHDTELGGVKIPAGSMVATMWGAANRDEREFKDPDRFDVARAIERHLAFGHGIHFCLGAALARLGRPDRLPAAGVDPRHALALAGHARPGADGRAPLGARFGDRRMTGRVRNGGTVRAETDMPDATSYLVGLIGSGIGPSLTPTMHETEAAELGHRLVYRRIDLDTWDLPPTAVGELVRSAPRYGFDGLNITHPCKQLVLPHLDDLTPDAAALGAVNTVVFDGGRAVGHNTDWWAFARSLELGLPAADRETVVLLGAGGAGAAVAHALMTSGTRDLAVVDTDRERAAGLAAALEGRFPGRRCREASPDEVKGLLADADGLVNATPIGMAHHPGLPIAAGCLHPSLWVADVVYRPLRTALLAEAGRIGCRTLDGGGMAVFQAAQAFELITGLAPDHGRMRAHFAAATRG